MAGLTNQLFEISLRKSVPEHIKPRKALFRVYGKSVGDLYDSSFELKVFKALAKNHSAPKLIAEFLVSNLGQAFINRFVLRVVE